MSEPTILIIGAGTFGTSTAYHLAHASPSSQGAASHITIVDRNPSPPTAAAAIDVNRIVRTDYAKPLYCGLANEALHGWFWSLDLQRYFHKTGWLVLDERDGKSKASAGARKVFKERGFDQTLDVDVQGEVGVRWKGLGGSDLAGFESGYFNPEAGWVEAAAATANFMRVAEEKGVRRVVGSVKELILKDGGGGVKGVRLEDGTELTADKVVLAAGAWTSSLLSPVEDRLEIAERDRIERQARATAVVSAYYKLSSEETSVLAKPKDMPIVVFGKHGEVIPPSEEQTLLKYNLSAFMITNSVATASGRTISIPTTPAKSQYEVPAAVKKEMGRALTSKLLPEYVRDKQPDYWRICWDACTPTEDLLMCQHPHQKLDNLYVAVGGTFSGYK